MPSPSIARINALRARREGRNVPRKYKSVSSDRPTLPLGGATNTISRLTTETVQALGFPDKKYKFTDFEDALNRDIVLAAVCELKALRSSLTLGRYVHSNKAIEEWVNGVFNDMEGTLQDIAAKATIAAYYGFWCGEIVWSSDEPGHRGEWRVKEIAPLSLQKVKFQGTKYGLTGIEYNAGDCIRVIPISNKNPFQNKAIHIVSGNVDIRNEPFGLGLARRAMPYVKAKELLMAEWVVAGRNQSQGLLLGKADSNKSVQVLGPDGRPVKTHNGQPSIQSAVHLLQKQLEEIDGRGFMVTDLENQVNWQPLNIDSGFYDMALRHINRQILLSQLAPSLTFEEGMSSSLGTAGVAEQTRFTLDAIIRSINVRLRDALIEKVVRPMLIANFGVTARQGWGEFILDPEADPNQASTTVNNIISAVGTNLLTATDISVVNRVRELLGLAKQTEDQLLREIKQAAVAENLRYGTGDPSQLTPTQPPPSGGEAPEDTQASYPPTVEPG